MSLELDLSRIIRRFEGRADQVLRAVCLQLADSVVMRSPVDTGRFRANWQSEIGQAATGVKDSEDPTGATAINEAAAKIAGLSAGQTFYLANNLPYAAALEYGLYSQGPGATSKTTGEGFSTQAPRGMVRVTVAEFQRHVDEAARR
jgi:hypothetical protein